MWLLHSSRHPWASSVCHSVRTRDLVHVKKQSFLYKKYFLCLPSLPGTLSHLEARGRLAAHPCKKFKYFLLSRVFKGFELKLKTWHMQSPSTTWDPRRRRERYEKEELSHVAVLKMTSNNWRRRSFFCFRYKLELATGASTYYWFICVLHCGLLCDGRGRAP